MKRRYFLENYTRKSYASVVHVCETCGGSELSVYREVRTIKTETQMRSCGSLNKKTEERTLLIRL